MDIWNGKILWSSMFLLAGAVGPSVKYPDPVCAATGSTVTLPCTFTPPRFYPDQNRREILLQVVKVLWCQNHLICHGSTPSVYSSQPHNKNNPRYQYLGDLKENCTLQIRDVQKDDDAVLRFRMEVNYTVGHFTNQSGVKITVVDGIELRVKGSSTDTEPRSGQTLALYCTSVCTFNQLEVTWFRDGHALSESSPTLQLGPLTAKDSGNYTCALKTSPSTCSQPYSLLVGKDSSVNYLLIAGVASGVLLALSSLTLIIFISRRKRVAVAAAAVEAANKDQRAVGEEAGHHYDNLYRNILQPEHPQKNSQAPDDVNYASVKFKQMNHTRGMEEADNAVIYTSLANRG